MADKIRNFRDLEIWKRGMSIAKTTYDLTRKFPRDEIYGLSSQMRRSAISIPSNIAEGFNRYHNKEYRQFLFIALGSCAELETQSELSCQFNYFDKKILDEILDSLDQESRMIRTLIKKL